MSIKNFVPNIIIDGVIVSTLVVGTALVLPKILYSILAKEGVFSD